MGSVVNDDVADLTPAPLVIESFQVTTPLVFAECGPTRIILPTSTTYETGQPNLVLDVVKEAPTPVPVPARCPCP